MLLTQITKIGEGGDFSTCVLQAEEDVLDRIIPGLTVLCAKLACDAIPHVLCWRP